METANLTKQQGKHAVLHAATSGADGMSGSLGGRVALVNRAGKGFGATIAEALPAKPVNREHRKSGRREQVLANTPLRRTLRTAAVVPAMLFLARDDSRHMTGVFLLRDGGHSRIGA